MKYICELCGYEYDEKIGDAENGILPGTELEELSSDWTCPLCGETEDDFEPVFDDEGEEEEI